MVKNEINYSQNNNGIFIDLNFLNENCLIEIKAFLDFIEENKKHINEIETKIMRVHNYLITKRLTTLSPEELTHQLNGLKFEYIRVWEEILDITGDKAILNI